MNKKSSKLPIIFFALGLVAAVVAYLLTGIVLQPTVTEYDFDYSVTYKLNGETLTLEDVYTCRFTGNGRDGDPRARYYEGTNLLDEGSYHPGQYIIDEKDGFELRIVTIFTDDYLMGDGDWDYSNEVYLAAFDDMGVEYSEPEILEKFDAEIISYELPEPIENSFVFAGFSVLHDLSMIAMYGVSLLVVLACIIFVRRDEGVTYNALDTVSVVFNFIISIAVIPFILLVVWLSQIFTSIYSFIYQFELCIPALGMFAVAASLCLRRKGYRKSGFFVQFIGPALFVVTLVYEEITIVLS